MAFLAISSYILKYCNPIGQFSRLPVACVGFVFFNQVDVHLPLDVEIIPGKFYRNQLYGMGMHSEQADRQTFFFIYMRRSISERNRHYEGKK